MFLCSACTGATQAGPGSVFTVVTGESTSVPVHVDEIQDAGLPGLFNNSKTAVVLRSVQLVHVPPAVQVLNVRAYNTAQVGYGYISLQAGDLAVECPGQFVPKPVTSFTIPPNKLAAWFVVIELRIARPGTYVLGRAKITYSTPSGTGWQYQNLNDTFYVTNPPLPGPAPLGTASVCGRP